MIDHARVVRLGEIGAQALDDGLADLIHGVELLPCIRVACGEVAAGLAEGLKGAVAAGQRAGGGLTDVTNTQGVDEALERNAAAGLDGGEEIAHRDCAETLLLLEFDRAVAAREGEDVRRLGDPTLLVEEIDLLFTQTFDIESAAGNEVTQVLDALVRAGELAGTAGDGAFLAGRGESRTTVVASGQGQVFGKANASVCSGLRSRTTARTCGITSPARCTVTVSPILTSSSRM